MTPLDFRLRLMQLACRFPFRTTSGYRDPASNAAVGGHPNSKHMIWEAEDIVPLQEQDKRGIEVEAQRLGLKVIDEIDHLHLQTP